VTTLRQITVVPVVALGLGPLLTACAGGQVERVTAYEESTRPVLLVAPETNAGSDAVVAGALGVNEAGCFTIGEDVLLAPHGSTVIADGTGIDLPGVGEVGIGEQIDGGGGYLQGRQDLRPYDDCARGAGATVAVLNPAD